MTLREQHQLSGYEHNPRSHGLLPGDGLSLSIRDNMMDIDSGLMAGENIACAPCEGANWSDGM
jgi:hypothetical protein